jgi:glutamine amidotransferase
MKKTDVVIIDYGVGNLFNLQRAFNTLGVNSMISNEKEKILNAERILLPGVGAFETGMKQLHENDLLTTLLEFADSGKPMMGICLGMQLLMSESEENGNCAGLNLIPGKVIRFQEPDVKSGVFKIPHIGWSALNPLVQANLLENLETTPFMYFIHSYLVVPDDPSFCVATTSYGKDTFCSVIKRKNVSGCQFHPERSGDYGLNLLRNFVLEKRENS